MDIPGKIAGHIGTPLTGNATKVLLLGAGELGKQLAISFQSLGLEVHAVDKYQGAPAHQVAHYSYIADITDSTQVSELVQQIQPHYVVPEVEIVAVEALEQVEQSTDAVVVPTARACALTQDRERVRAVAEDIGLPTSAYRFASSVEELEEAATELGFPCIVKPDVSTSGKGHMLARDVEDVREAWETVRRVSSDSQRVVAERFVDFDLAVTLLAIRTIDPATGKLATWFSEPIGHRHEKGDLIEEWQPTGMSEIALENARSVAARISNELGGRGVYGVELFVAGDDVYFSSVSPRPSDTAMLTAYTQRFSQFDLHARDILGYPIDATLITPGASMFLHAQEPLADVAFTGIASALHYAETDVKLFGKPDAYKGRRMGLVTTTAETVEEARDRAALAAHKVSVTSTPGLLAQGGARGIDPQAENVPDIEVVEYEGGVELDPKLTSGVDDTD